MIRTHNSKNEDSSPLSSQLSERLDRFVETQEEELDGIQARLKLIEESSQGKELDSIQARLQFIEESSQGEELDSIQTRLQFIEESLRAKEKRSVIPVFWKQWGVSPLNIVLVSTVAALVLGFAVFASIQSFQWRGALAEMRAEPGIQIMSVRMVSPLKRQVHGLRDPLAPNPLVILEKHNIAASRVDLKLTEYHSLNTPYGREREQIENERFEGLRNTLVGVVGNLAEENRQMREEELGRISQLLLDMRFPEAMKKLQLKYDNGVWHADGKLPENEFVEFKAMAHHYILNGVVDLENIGNYTEEKRSSLVEGIESTNLLDIGLDGEPVHVARVARLIREYDQLSSSSGFEPERINLVLLAGEPEEYQDLVNEIANQLTDQASLVQSRIRISVAPSGAAAAGGDRLSIKVSDGGN